MNNRTAAIVAGCPTPLARTGTVFRDLTALNLGKTCVRGLIERNEVGMLTDMAREGRSFHATA